MRGGGVLGGRGGANFWYNDDDDVDQFFRLGGRLTQVDGWEGLQKNGCSKSGPKMPIAISGNPSFFPPSLGWRGDRFGPTSTSRCHWRWRQAFLGEFRDEAVKMQSRSGSPLERLRETQTGENEAKVDKNGRRKL
jgi:hypothetical protein